MGHLTSQLQAALEEKSALSAAASGAESVVAELRAELAATRSGGGTDPKLQKALARVTELEAVITKAKAWRAKQLSKAQSLKAEFERELSLRDIEIQRLHTQLGLDTEVETCRH